MGARRDPQLLQSAGLRLTIEKGKPLHLICRSYAKINLYLDVLGKRDDGYHDIETIFQSVSLHDETVLTLTDSEVSLKCSMPDLCEEASNLAYKAAMLIKESTGTGKGVRIDLHKNIPVAAGLAGGSGNAAAVLAGLNKLWNLGLSAGDLAELALKLGSDVPFCLKGGTAQGTARGELIEALDPLEPTWFVLVHPPIHVSSGSVYSSKELCPNLQMRSAGKSEGFRQAIETLREGTLEGMLFNRMERVVFGMHPALEKIKGHLGDLGCPGSLMSGSGPTIFGICSCRKKAQRIAAKIADYPASIVRSVDTGVKIEEAV